jgi:hypothetical protein
MYSVVSGFAGALEPKIKGEREMTFFERINIIILIQSPTA